jgi:hypothetical protein
MQPIHGQDILLSIKIDADFYPVLCAVDMTFQCSQEVLLATSVDTGVWRRKRLRNLSEWSVSLSGLTKIDNTDGQVSFFYLLQQNIRGAEQVIQIMFTDADLNTQVLEGTVLIPDLSINGNVSSFGDVNITFEGTGEVIIQEAVSDVVSGVCEDLISDTWILAEGATGVSGLGQQGRSFAGMEILEVDREGLQHDFASGAAGNREYSYNGTTISFDITNPGLPGGETVFVMWKA